MLEIIASLAVGILLLLNKFIVNSVVGAVLLSIVKLLGFHVTINIFTSLAAGIFGVPSVLMVLAWSYL